MDTEYAVIVRNAQKRYTAKEPILNGLNLSVKKGTIYGLLGASGCGKSTLLSCVVGVRKLDDGDLWVLGGRPGTPGSGIPGPRVGYMPQEISLCEESTVLGSLYYFGRINNMEDHDIEERYDFLRKLLQLPPSNRLIRNTSGGQKRRVSFAAALINSPELLILDEPTVGLDPVLRDDIWNFLIRTATEEKTTVIITTHYIEETRQAHTIGLLRRGTLLAESPPAELLQKYQTESLEDAFLALSQAQEGDIKNSTPVYSSNANISATCDFYEQNLNTQCQYKTDTPSYTARKMKALIRKNIVQVLRNPSEIVFSLILPVMQTIIFFSSIGGDPNGIKIYVVNDEAGNCNNGMNLGNVTYNEEDYACYFNDLSCRFINGFGDTIVEQVYWHDLKDAQGMIKKTQYTGVIHYSKNFSRGMENRLADTLGVTNEDILASEIDIYLDMGDRQIGLFLQNKIYERYGEILTDIMSECQIPRKVASLPVHFDTPVFGRKDETYTEFVMPTFLLTLVFFLATAVCSSIIIADRSDGVWNRSLVQGVKTFEILLAHASLQLTVLCVQTVIATVMTFGIFNIECKGSFGLVFAMVYLSGVCGMIYGLLISIICTSHIVANFISTGSFYPIILLCGCMWPIEGMPKLLRWISLVLPATIPGIALRAITVKGHGLEEWEICIGFLVFIAWIAFVFALCIYCLRTKQG